MSMATESAQQLRQQYGNNPLWIAGRLGIEIVMQDLDTPHGALVRVEGRWAMFYTPATTEARLAHLVGHYTLHRDIRQEFVTSRYGLLDTEANEFADELLRLDAACLTA